MDKVDWLRFSDITMARYAFAGRCAVKQFEDRVREMSDVDYVALSEQIDDASIRVWIDQTRRERDLDIAVY